MSSLFCGYKDDIFLEIVVHPRENLQEFTEMNKDDMNTTKWPSGWLFTLLCRNPQFRNSAGVFSFTEKKA